jgi:hypothetical protein
MAMFHLIAGQVGPHKVNKGREMRPHFGYILSGTRREFEGAGPVIGGAFPNSIALNHMELPPPLLSRRG